MWTLLAIAAGALTMFGLLAWRHEMRERENSEATPTTDGPEQFRGFHAPERQCRPAVPG
jgi:hypothetical protein